MPGSGVVNYMNEWAGNGSYVIVDSGTGMNQFTNPGTLCTVIGNTSVNGTSQVSLIADNYIRIPLLRIGSALGGYWSADRIRSGDLMVAEIDRSAIETTEIRIQ